MSHEQVVLKKDLDPQFRLEEVIVAGDRGPCGGVNMAIEAIVQVLDIVRGKENVFISHAVVNNVPLMKTLEERGLVVEKDPNKVPDNSIYVISAHGAPPSFRRTAERKNCLVIDVTCPLVQKVHDEAIKVQEEGEHIIYIGADGHPEPEGVKGELDPKNITMIRRMEDVENLVLPTNRKTLVLTQTTLSTTETGAIMRAIKLKSPENVIFPGHQDICYAVDNRQAAVRKLMARVDFLLIVGSKTSHNSHEMVEIGKEFNKPSFSVDEPEEIKMEWFTDEIKKVGISSGASVREEYLEKVLKWFRERGVRITMLRQTEKERTFRLPLESIALLKKRCQAAN